MMRADDFNDIPVPSAVDVPPTGPRASPPWPHDITPPPSLPERLGDFRIDARVPPRRGGFGWVFKAYHTALHDQPVAIKVLRTDRIDESTLAQFDLEIANALRARHPGIVTLYSAGRFPIADQHLPYFAMEWIEEHHALNDAELLATLSLTDRVDLFIEVCRAVAHAHASQVVHGDLKPGNIAVVSVNGRPFPKILDFGLSRCIAGFLPPAPPAVGGTLRYLPPEYHEAGHTWRGPVVSTDVYALGVILREMLFAEAANLHAQVDDELLAIINRAEARLDAFPSRFASVDDLIAALVRWRSSPLRRAAAWWRDRRTRHPRLAAAALVAVCTPLAALLSNTLIWNAFPSGVPVPQSLISASIPTITAMPDVRVVRMTDACLAPYPPAPDAPQATAAPAMPPMPNIRAAVADLLVALRPARPSVVALDLFFHGPGPTDPILAKAIADLTADGVSVVIADSGWNQAGHRYGGPSRDLYSVPGVLSGPVSIINANPHPILPLFVERVPDPPVPSFALLTYVASKAPGRVPVARVSPDDANTVEIFARKPGPAAEPSMTPVVILPGCAVQTDALAPLAGIAPGDRVASFIIDLDAWFNLPIEPRTLGSVLAAPPAVNASDFAGKVVVVGDGRAGPDLQRHAGRTAPGCDLQAAAIQTLITGSSARAGGDSANWLALLLAAGAGVLVGGRLAVHGTPRQPRLRTPRARAIAAALAAPALILAVTGACLLTLAIAHVFIHPAPGSLAALLGLVAGIALLPLARTPAAASLAAPSGGPPDERSDPHHRPAHSDGSANRSLWGGVARPK